MPVEWLPDACPLQLPVYITEFSISGLDPAKHAYELEKFLRIAFSHDAVAGITMGDLWDKGSSRPYSGIYAANKQPMWNDAGVRYTIATGMSAQQDNLRWLALWLVANLAADTRNAQSMHDAQITRHVQACAAEGQPEVVRAEARRALHYLDYFRERDKSPATPATAAVLQPMNVELAAAFAGRKRKYVG